MFEDFENKAGDDDDDVQHHVCNSIEGLRDHVLCVFGHFLSHVSGQNVTDAIEHQRQFLEIWEVENIVKELSDVSHDGMYGIGANSFEEYKEKMLGLFRALGARLLSNVMAAGVKQGLLDAEYDFEKDAFAFSVTEKGMHVVSEYDDPAGKA